MRRQDAYPLTFTDVAAFLLKAPRRRIPARTREQHLSRDISKISWLLVAGVFGQNSFKPGDRTAEIQSRAELFYIPTLCRLGAASLTPGKHIYLPNQQLPQKPAVPADRWRHHVAHVLRGNERTDSAMVTKNIVSRSGHGPKTVLL